MCYRLKYTGKQVDDFLGLVESGNGQGVGPGYNYENLANLPEINGQLLKGDQTASELELVSQTELKGIVDRIDQKNEQQDTAIATLEEQAAVAATKNDEQDTVITQLKSRVTNVEQKNVVQDESIKALDESVKILNDGVADIQTKDQEQDTLIESLQADISRIDQKNEQQDTAIATLEE